MSNRLRLFIGIFGLILIAALYTDFQNHIRRHYENRMKQRQEWIDEKMSYLEIACRAKWPRHGERYQECRKKVLRYREDI